MANGLAHTAITPQNRTTGVCAEKLATQSVISWITAAITCGTQNCCPTTWASSPEAEASTACPW